MYQFKIMADIRLSINLRVIKRKNFLAYVGTVPANFGALHGNIAAFPGNMIKFMVKFEAPLRKIRTGLWNRVEVVSNYKT
jgi:hypothetical protein